MMKLILFYIAAGLTITWGIAHLIPTKSVVKEFGKITKDNRHIITMEWIIEGVTLIFLGILIALITIINPEIRLALILYMLIVVFLIVLTIISLFTGFRVDFFPYKLCPIIFSASAILIMLGVFI